MTAALNNTVSNPPAQPAPDRTRHNSAPVSPNASLDSAALLQGGKAVTIRHNGEFYRLQATRQGKLILTK